MRKNPARSALTLIRRPFPFFPLLRENGRVRGAFPVSCTLSTSLPAGPPAKRGNPLPATLYPASCPSLSATGGKRRRADWTLGKEAEAAATQAYWTYAEERAAEG